MSASSATLSPPHNTSQLALLAYKFFSLADFLPFSPNAEPGSRLERPSITCRYQLELLKMKRIN